MICDMSCGLVFPDIDPEGVEVLTFDFSNGLSAGETLIAPRLEVSSNGQDPLPSTRFSSPQISTANIWEVLVTATGCQEGNTYHLRVVAPTSNAEKTLVLPADITCRLM